MSLLNIDRSRSLGRKYERFVREMKQLSVASVRIAWHAEFWKYYVLVLSLFWIDCSFVPPVFSHVYSISRIFHFNWFYSLRYPFSLCFLSYLISLKKTHVAAEFEAVQRAMAVHAFLSLPFLLCSVLCFRLYELNYTAVIYLENGNCSGRRNVG
jgi:hypothetical protein